MQGHQSCESWLRIIHAPENAQTRTLIEIRADPLPHSAPPGTLRLQAIPDINSCATSPPRRTNEPNILPTRPAETTTPSAEVEDSMTRLHQTTQTFRNGAEITVLPGKSLAGTGAGHRAAAVRGMIGPVTNARVTIAAVTMDMAEGSSRERKRMAEERSKRTGIISSSGSAGNVENRVLGKRVRGYRTCTSVVSVRIL